jgi:hypothetical protein
VTGGPLPALHHTRLPVRADARPVEIESARGKVETWARVTTRVAPGNGLDSDNLPVSMKHVRDGIADAMGVDDRDERVTWEYAQERGKPGEYKVKVDVWT